MATNPKTRDYPPGGWDTTTVKFRVHPDGVLLAQDTAIPTELFHLEDLVANVVSILMRAGPVSGGTTWRLRVNDVTNQFVIDDFDNAKAPFKINVNSASNTLLIEDGAIGIGHSPVAEVDIGLNGILALLESVEPTATAGRGKVWCVSDGTLWFQDPDLGDPHLVIGPAYQIMRFHGIADHTRTIPTQAQMIKFDGTNAVGLGDEFGHITGSTTNDELTVGAADGIYELGWFASLRAQGGASREVILNLGVELFSPISVTGATGSGISPIVLTIAGLAGTDGLLMEIAGVGGNTAANGSWIINASTSTTIELYSLSRVASTGNGTYTADTGQLTIYYPSFNLAHTEVSQNTLLLNGGGSTGGGVHLNDGDKVALYASNLDGTQSLDFAQAVFGIRRISGPRSGVVPLIF